MIEVLTIKCELEKMTAQVRPEDFGEVKLDAWMRFEAEFSDYLVEIKDEVQSLISSSSSYLRNDQTES